MVLKPSTGPVVLSVKAEPSPETPAELYLDLIKKTLTRVIVANGLDRRTIHPTDGAKSRLIHWLNMKLRSFGAEIVRLSPSSAEDYLESGREAANRIEDAETMLGTRQLDSMQHCIADVLENDVPGDLLEAGVWRGGMTIFMRAVLAAHCVRDRKVWVVDSFSGLPEIDREHDTFEWHRGQMMVSLSEVECNFARYGLLDDQVKFLKGFFSDTLVHPPIERLAILRVDADLYTSTMDVLTNLYPRLSPGGYAVFDDYQNLPDCRRAIDEFRVDNQIKDEIKRIDDRAVLWQKTR
jgi:O-methyltransferase